MMNLRKLFTKPQPSLTWNDITVGQFTKINAVVENKELTEDEKTYRIFNIITGKDGRKMNLKEFNKSLLPITELLNTEMKHGKLKKRYTLNGTVYKSLVDTSVITAGQYFDYNHLMNTKDFAKILSVFLVPEGHYYNDGDYDLDDVINDINNYLPITELNSLIFFFKAKVKKSVVRFLGYSVQVIIRTKGITWKQKRNIIRLIKATLLSTVS